MIEKYTGEKWKSCNVQDGHPSPNLRCRGSYSRARMQAPAISDASIDVGSHARYMVLFGSRRDPRIVRNWLLGCRLRLHKLANWRAFFEAPYIPTPVDFEGDYVECWKIARKVVFTFLRREWVPAASQKYSHPNFCIIEWAVIKGHFPTLCKIRSGLCITLMCLSSLESRTEHTRWRLGDDTSKEKRSDPWWPFDADNLWVLSSQGERTRGSVGRRRFDSLNNFLPGHLEWEMVRDWGR